MISPPHLFGNHVRTDINSLVLRLISRTEKPLRSVTGLSSDMMYSLWILYGDVLCEEKRSANHLLAGLSTDSILSVVFLDSQQPHLIQFNSRKRYKSLIGLCTDMIYSLGHTSGQCCSSYRSSDALPSFSMRSSHDPRHQTPGCPRSGCHCPSSARPPSDKAAVYRILC